MGSGSLSCGLKCAKILLFVFNFIFWLCGAAMLGLGIWIVVDSSSLSKISDAVAELVEGRDLKTVAYLFIALGAFIFVIGFCGCCGAIKEVKCLLGIYILFVSLIIIIEIVAVVLGFVYKSELEKFIKDEGFKFIQEKYDAKQPASVGLNFIQHEFKCCGLDKGAKDYDGSNYTSPVNKVSPWCCKTDSDYDEKKADPIDLVKCNLDATNCFAANDCESAKMDFLNGQSCLDSAEDWIAEHYLMFIGVALAFAIVQLFGLIFAICLCREVGKDE